MERRIARLVVALGLAFLSLGALTMISRSAAPAVEEAEGAAQEAGQICFWSEQGPVCVGRRVEVRAAGLDTDGLLAALLAGPAPDERERGLWSAIPEGTASRGVEIGADRTVVVRLETPPQALREIDHGTFEIIVRQIGYTLEPLGWRDLRIQAWDPVAEQFAPLASFLPQIPAPRKEMMRQGEQELEIAPAHVGQPPAPGQGQPRGALSGKTVYVSAGHGWLWNSTSSAWRTQRPPYPTGYAKGPIIEDHNNAEAVNQYLLQYLWNAGAMVIPVRERDMNGAEVVVDNDDPITDAGYSESGVWTTTAASGAGYAGADYRWTETVTGTATAAAVWTATLPADGEYAVYVWYRHGSNRAPDARYTIHHAGGETEVIVDQQRHGITWRYVGSYGFRGGEEARVTLDNRSDVAGAGVIADAVRFGGGTFDDLSGVETAATYAPDKPWWEAAAFYYTQRMGMSQPPGDVTARPIYARWEHAGADEDAVYVSWHTNGYSGYQWERSGTETYAHNGVGLPRTEGSLDLRQAIHSELVRDIQAGWDPEWIDRGQRLANFGELRLLWDEEQSARMPGALIEIAYHDHPGDTDALKEPTFNALAARAVYQGIVHYFEQRDGIDLVELPEPPTHLRVQNLGGGQVRVSWNPSPTDTLRLAGDAAIGYRVYTSTDGLGWSNGAPVTGTTAYTLTGLAQGSLLFVRVAAANAGGESFPSETLGARVGTDAEVLLVSGFDRLNNTMTVPDYDPVEGYNLRMFLDQMNRYDYAVHHGETISYTFDCASNEALSDTLVSLGDYKLVDWILGEESAPDETLNAAERALLEAFLDGGGALFVSGSELGWHLDYLEEDADFYNSRLRADYVGDDAESYDLIPVPGSIFEGLGLFRFDALEVYAADYPDQIAPVLGSQAALSYYSGLKGTAAVQYAEGCQRLVYFGFPFETIRPGQRPAVMERVLDFLDECLGAPVDTEIVVPAYGSAHNSAPPFEGTARAQGAAVLDRVEVQIQRGSQYWAESGWVTSESWLTATGKGVWSYTLPSLSDGEYHLRARAWTLDPYSDTSPAEVVFVYDTVSPTGATLITPTGGVAFASATGIVLEWQPVGPDGGSDLAYVVMLDGRQLHTTTQSAYTVTQIADGPHTWGVQVLDAAGNRSGWVTATFSIARECIWLPLVVRGFEAPPGECIDAVVNGGFESDEGWISNRAAYTTTNFHSGARSVQVGILPGEPGGGKLVYSSVRQEVTLASGSSAELRLWVYPIGEGGDSDDWHYVVLYDQWDGYHLLEMWQSNGRAWEQRQYDLSAYLGQTVRLYVGARNDGDDDTAALYVDDVALEVCP